MIQYISDSDIERFIEEDVPYGDLTTSLLSIGGEQGSITYTTREETTLCCTEEAGRLLNKVGAETTFMLASGTTVTPGTDILEARGTVASLHCGWKMALNLLEYASGVASRTSRVVKAARAANPDITVVTTRKSFPGTKKIVIKAIMAGGALPHRLGLSETILVFKQHTAFMGGLEEFLKTVPQLRKKAKETKIIVEADTVDEALLIAQGGVDVVQIDKMKPDELAALVKEIRSVNPDVKISAAGGINESNTSLYAATGVDIIVLSSVYFGKPSDVKVRIIPV
ncbi:MAG TPA: ModD protein [Syntrophorhabdaceae bacterium]|nr:ModD protein [Syntrophorhabdaceae bacterium]